MKRIHFLHNVEEKTVVSTLLFSESDALSKIYYSNTHFLINIEQCITFILFNALKIVCRIPKMTRLNASTPKKQNSQSTPNQPKIDNFPPKPPIFDVFDAGQLF